MKKKNNMDEKVIEKVYRLKSEQESITKVLNLMSSASQTSLHDQTGSFGLYLHGSVAGHDVELDIKREVYTCIEMALKDRRGQIQYELGEL